MKTAPVIIVQLIHIEGPLKGKIVELPDQVIKIGRHPSCQLKYPKDLAIISREHAVISREGNRYKITDHSSNGTIVNGKKISEIFLKDGDVITVSEGGPKVSFLTQVTDTPLPPKTENAAPIPEAKPIPTPQQPPVQDIPKPEPEEAKELPSHPSPLKSKVPLIIQYGPTLQSFDELPLKIGSHPSNGYNLNHPAILEMHGEIYFADGQYFIKDLTGRKLVTNNNVPAEQGIVIQQNDMLSFSPTGPFFRYLGDGRLSEEDQEVDEMSSETENSSPAASRQAMEPDKGNNPLSLIKKFLKKM